MNGYLAIETVKSTGEIVPWLQEAIAHFYPESVYASSLDPAKERAQRRLFQAPKLGASVVCPHCGAPNSFLPGWDELFVFICSRCGESVEVPRPKVQ